MADNLLQLNPAQSSNLNQQSFVDWQNSLIQAADMAKNLNPATLAGMTLGQALGTWGGWKVGNWWQNLQEKLRTKHQSEQAEKIIDADNLSVQNQIDWAKQNGIQKPQAVSLLGGLINQQAMNAKNGVDFSKPYSFSEMNPYQRYAMTNPNASVAEINRAGNLDWRNRLNEKFIQPITDKFNRKMNNTLNYPFPKIDILSSVSRYNPAKNPYYQKTFDIGYTPSSNNYSFTKQVV